MDDRKTNRLAAASRAGDQRSFRILVDALTRPLMAVAYRYTRDWDTARDLCQETWVKVHEQFHRYDPARPFRAWLFTVHRNGCLSYLRKAAVRYELTVEDTELQGIPQAAGNPNPLAQLEEAEFHRRLQQAIVALSPAQQLVFTCVDLEQRDQREAAEELGMKFTTLRTTLHFARKRLAELLRQMEAEP
jgi:RNA polymerase sigma-70 factor (ECF subfamily)